MDGQPERNCLRIKDIVLNFETLGVINLCIQQNDIPIVQELGLYSEADTPYTNLKLRITTTPELTLPWEVNYHLLQPKDPILHRNVKLQLDYSALSSLTEPLAGQINLEIYVGEQLLGSHAQPLMAFPPDHWLGLNVMPETLASFVTPNLDVINLLLASAAQELKKTTGSSAISGYQEGKRKAYEICAAIYDAIHNWGINYSNPPASLGTPGQKIRFADAIHDLRLATCLDLTLLFASALEQAGLYPVIMLQEGHAYIGCHLEDDYFPDSPTEDLQAIRKLVNMDDFLVLETTMVTGNATFSEAEQAARDQHLNLDDDFNCAIDVMRSRLNGIKPLPLKHSVKGIEFLPPPQIDTLQKEKTRQLQQAIDLSRLTPNHRKDDPVARWTEKLLDLSLRNRLLNAKLSSKVIPILCSDISQLEDKLAANQEVTFHSMEKMLKTELPQEMAQNLDLAELPQNLKQLLAEELLKQRLWTPLGEKDLQRNMIALYRQTKTDLEEGGVNTLFLAVGFLQWKQSPKDEKAYDAPILLIPVKLKRKNIAEGIQIARLDEDTVVNETMLALLRTQFQLEIPGLNPLPTDEAGVDVQRIMQIFKQSIKNMTGWEVKEEARLGHFSFGKFIMWNDMTARIDELKSNPLVRHLISGGGIYDDGIQTFPPDEIAKHLDLQHLFCPMSADSSQLAAVIYSQLGKSFVLHGPPGTGKSQTITNIIAHNLALGRRVLFVSEKKAALDVVHKRLTKVGLRPFCLELHSNKSGKTDVLQQFNEALNVPDTHEDERWEHTARKLTKIRQELNDYVTELHRLYPNHLSAYDCFSQLLIPHDKLPDDLLDINCLTQTQEQLEDLNRLVQDLASSCRNLDREAMTQMEWLPDVDWSPIFQQSFLKEAQTLQQDMKSMLELIDKAWPESTLGTQLTPHQIQILLDLLQAVKSCPNLPAPFISNDFKQHQELLLNIAQNAIKAQELEERLHSYDLQQLLTLDVPAVTDRIQANQQAFFLLRFFRNKGLLRELAGLKKLGAGKLTIPELTEILPLTEAYQTSQKQIKDAQPQAQKLMGDYWQDDNTDWKALAPMLEQTRTILELTQKLASKNTTAREELLAFLREKMPQAQTCFADSAAEGKQLKTLRTAGEKLLHDYRAFLAAAPQLATCKTLNDMDQRLQNLHNHAPHLRAVLLFKKLLLKAEEQGIRPFANLMLQDDLKPDDAPEAFQALYGQVMLNQLLPQATALCRFSGATQERRIQDFCDSDQQYTELTKQIIFAKLAAQLPRRRAGDCPEGTELGILKRECKKKARQKPVRQLLEQIPELTKVLKPCFLMSPLSVAQYLPPNTDAFDLIVFDEASQIPVWDAIGVIARGKQLIVVGDPKQMPPTNFFQKGNAEDTDDSFDMEEDLESILDECIAAGVHSAYLNWHYRSRHESLISFSNHYYYDDKLFTFPAAKLSTRLGLRFQFVPNGVYDRKKTRTNRAEAEALVSYVFQQLEQHLDRERSIGVVTFSQAQKDLIEDLMEQERANHPALEAYFSDQNDEPPFVKNLENVQGDERDVILFSIGYAPDEQGKFTMNFGPLNRQGGERRLNVAITRAKEQVVVFSSIHAPQIDLARTQATGAAHLKFFLDYAEKGFPVTASPTRKTSSEGLIDSIETFLKQQDFQVERNIGCSGFRIDLAVRNPQHPDQYLLGIECDGEAYANQRTTRDRDHLRDSVLHNLGWHTYRAWTVDWAFDRQRAEQNLLSLIQKIQDNPDPMPAPKKPTQPEPHQTYNILQTNLEPSPVQPTPPPENQRTYEIWTATTSHQQEEFYNPASLRKIRQELHDIITTEGPICQRLLKKRIIKAWGFTRAGDQIMHVLQQALPKNLKTTADETETVYWQKDAHPDDFQLYRVPMDDQDENKRNLEDIPYIELANAMRQILKDFNSCEVDTLYRETIKLFGFTALTAKARKILDAARQHLTTEAH